ncbi:unnamed protein product, partial [Prorocentrum cordatum]
MSVTNVNKVRLASLVAEGERHGTVDGSIDTDSACDRRAATGQRRGMLVAAVVAPFGNLLLPLRSPPEGLGVMFWFITLEEEERVFLDLGFCFDRSVQLLAVEFSVADPSWGRAKEGDWERGLGGCEGCLSVSVLPVCSVLCRPSAKHTLGPPPRLRFADCLGWSLLGGGEVPLEFEEGGPDTQQVAWARSLGGLHDAVELFVNGAWTRWAPESSGRGRTSIGSASRTGRTPSAFGTSPWRRRGPRRLRRRAARERRSSRSRWFQGATPRAGGAGSRSRAAVPRAAEAGTPSAGTASSRSGAAARSRPLGGRLGRASERQTSRTTSCRTCGAATRRTWARCRTT